MKPIFTCIFLTVTLFAHSQSTGARDTSISCLTNWRLGDSYTYSITHDKNTSIGGKPAPGQQLHTAYEATVTVIDQTKDDYTIKWVIHIPASLKTGRPGLADSLRILEGMQLIYRIADVGNFVELINWEEIRDDDTRLMVMSMPESGDSAAAATALARLRAAYPTRQAVEASLIREIQLFHMPYGYAYTTTPIIENTTLGNPFEVNGKPLPAIQSCHVTTAPPEQDRYTLLIRQYVDKTQAAPLLKDKTAAFQLDDNTQYRFIRSTGWPFRLSFTRNAVYQDLKQTDVYTIALKSAEN